MKKELRFCDRCSANISSVPPYIPEIELSAITEEFGKTEIKVMELCHDCLNSLVKWFGQTNPFTGECFARYKDK